MKNIKKGCVVVRKSYNKDILFRVTKIIKNCSANIAILHGITERIEADSPLCDLEILDSASIAKVLSDFNKKTDNKLNEVVLSKKLDKFNIAILSKNRDIKEKVITGKILHLDGDKQYSNKSYYYYKKLYSITSYDFYCNNRNNYRNNSIFHNDINFKNRRGKGNS